MDPITAGALIGGGAALLGGAFSGREQRKATQANIDHQREFAQHGLRWKVEDAKAAGVHPLYALGASTHSFAPSITPNTGMSDAISSAGQNVGRAVAQTSTANERAFNDAMKAEQLKNARLQNTLLEGQITSVNKITQPAWPGSSHALEGQGNSSLVSNKPLERVASQPGKPYSEPGAITDVGWVAVPGGGLAPVPSKDVKERIEDQLVPEMSWAMRNQLMPNLIQTPKPPRSALPKGYDRWEWSFKQQAYFPAKKTIRPSWYKSYHPFIK